MKKRWCIWGVSALLYAVGVVCSIAVDNRWCKLIFFGLSWIVVGWKVVWKALRNIAHGQIFDENFLMLVASVGAFAIGEGAEGAAVMLFYQLGEIFESMAVAKSRRSVTELMSIRPDTATVLRDGQASTVSPEDVATGETIVVSAGEKIPLDGVILTGFSSLDTAALTGESLPRDVSPGDSVYSGSVNGGGVLTIRTTGTYGESTVAKILDMVENAAARKSRSENFITRFAAVYTPAVVGLAVLLAILPPLLFHGAWKTWLYRALEFLVVSCPCALVISVPLSFFGGIGGASRQGILIKGSSALEQLAKTKIAAFDKTGTITKGTFHIGRICPREPWSEEKLLTMAAIAESGSTHPIARSLMNASRISGNDLPNTDAVEEAGYGICASVDGKMVLVGNEKLLTRHGISCTPAQTEPGETPIYVAIGTPETMSYAGWIGITDQMREETPAMLRGLKQIGVQKTVLLTGDKQEVGEKIAGPLGIDMVKGGLLPGDKVSAVETLLEGKKPGETLVYLGDGINDAPVLARADVGIAMGGLGSDAAMEAADAVIMSDDPSKLVTAIRIANKTMTIVYQNIVFAIGVKVLVMVLAALGIAGMWLAVFADVGVSVIAIANALRCLKA